MSYSTDNIVAMLSINEYLSFALKMVLAFGLIFEMPLFSFFLARMGIITAQKMRDVRKYAVLAIFCRRRHPDAAGCVLAAYDGGAHACAV